MPYKKAFMVQNKNVIKEGLVSGRQSEDYSKNVYSLPLRKSKITEFGARGFSPAHEGNLNNSIDLIAPEGTEVYAMASGTVVEARDSSNVHGMSTKYWDKGNYIEILHRLGEYSWYEHLKFRGVVVKVGDKVKRGELIGYSGNTGFTYEPHLHIQVNRYINMNPRDFVTLKIRFRDFPDVYKLKRE